MGWITEDIGMKIYIQQFAGKKGIGAEHLIVCMMDRILGLLDKPGMTAIIRSSADWKNAFDRTDPTKTIQKCIRMGIRASLIPIIIEFLSDRKMSVKFNQKESKIFTLIGGGPQGSQTGQASYIISSDDNAYHVPEDDRYKYCDDLSMLELVMLGDILMEYDMIQHVASDIKVGERFLDPQNCRTQENFNQVASWTSSNLMVLNEDKCDYQIFTRAREQFAARFFANGKLLERKYVSKVLGVWLQEDGEWAKNTSELCKRSYAKMKMLTKLKYAGVSRNDLLDLYKLFIRGSAEYCSVAWHSGLTQAQSKAIEKIQSTALKIILNRDYISYEDALLKTGLTTLYQRRQERCLSFSLKCLNHPQNKRLFPRNVENNNFVRDHEEFKVNHAYNNFYKNSAIPFNQRLLNKHAKESRQEKRRRGGE